MLEAEAGLDLKRDVAFVAGHSLGEYSALAAAGSLSRRRYGAAPAHPRQRHAERRAGRPGRHGGPARARLEAVAQEVAAARLRKDEVCDVGNDNGGGQVVVSGDKAAVERAVAIAPGKGAKRAIMLTVSAPFHCALMRPAADAMREALAGVAVEAPAVPVVANVEAAADHRSGGDPRRPRAAGHGHGALARERRLRWQRHGVDTFVEVGPGKVLTGLVKRIAAGATATASARRTISRLRALSNVMSP